MIPQVQQPVQYGYLYKCIAAFASNWTRTNSATSSVDVGEYVYSLDGLDDEDN